MPPSGRELSALHARAVAFIEGGRAADALPLLEQCIAGAPDDAGYRFALGVAHLQAGNRSAAADAFRAAAARRAGYVEAMANLGACLADLGQAAAALVEFERALAYAPQDVDLLCNAALAAIESGAPAQALAYLERAAPLRLREARIHDLSGIACMALGRHAQAEPHFRAALARAPRSVQHAMGLCAALARLEREAEAIEVWRGFLALEPQDARAHQLLALLLLGQGRMDDAMPHYAYRPGRQGRPVPPLEALRGARVLIETEQGIGDELFFLRWLPAFRGAAAPAEVGYLPSPRFATLARAISGIDTHWNGPPEAWPGPRLLAGDLPALMGGSPAPSLVLAPEAARQDRARRELLARGRPPFLGVAWEGGIAPAASRLERIRQGQVLHKRIPPDALGAALKGYPGTVVVMQRAPRPEDLAAFAQGFGASPPDFSSVQEDIVALHALLGVLDEHVGASSTAMHLRAATGLTARVLVPHPAEWRWLAHGDASPWFPGFAVYREARGTGWRPALARLRADLGIS